MPIIRQKDIYDPSKGNPVEQLTKDLNLLVGVEKVLIKQNKELAKSLQLIKKSNDGKEAKELAVQTEKLSKSTLKLKEVKTASVRVNEQLTRARTKLIESQTKEAKELAKVNAQLAKNRKELRDNAKEAIKLDNAYDELVRSTNKAQKNFKRLAAQFGVNSKQAKAARVEFDKLDKELRQINTASKDGRRDVGRYGTALQGVGRQLLGATGIVGGATLLVGAIRNGIKVFRDFEKSASKLAAIVGKSKNEISALTNQAKQLGATTAFTASEVISLQTELAKLGFSLREIEDSTPGILDLAAATGTDLASAAELAGATLRIFNLDASEMSRVTDVLAKSTTISSLSMEKLATILPTVGKTAQLAGVSLEETAALAGTLTDRGLDASSAATSLRNIFLELSKQGITWNEAMQRINTSTDKNKTAMDLFGKRAAAAGVILAETSVGTDKLTESLNNAEGAASQMAETMLDNLAGDITKAQSAWEGFILSLEDGNGIISLTFRAITQTGTGILNMLTALNTEYTNLAIKGQEMNKAAADAIPFWETQTATIEILLPALKKVREESERIANLRAKNIKGLQNENEQVKTFIFQQDVLNGQQAAEVKNLIRTLKFKKEKEGLNKVENALLSVAAEKLAEYNRFLALSTQETNKNTSARKINKKAIFDQNSELEKQREDYERLIELQKRASELEGLDAIETRTTDTQVQETQLTPIAGGFFGQNPVDEAKELTEQVNEVIEKENENRRQRELEKELAFQEAKKELANSFLNQTFDFAKDIAATNTEERLSEIEANAEAEKEILQQRLDDGLISEAEFRQQVADIDKKARQDSAKAEKRGALFQIGIDTAAAVVKALGSAPPPFNFINAGLVAAQAAIQAALVAAKPLPAFYSGTESVPLGNNKKGRDTILARVNEGERIVPTAINNKIPSSITNDMLPDLINKGLTFDTPKGMTRTQTDGLKASLLMQGNKINSQILTAVLNGGFGSENKDFYITHRNDGSITYTPKQ